jgi:F0F1-type ATP synthase assembly protein I
MNPNENPKGFQQAMRDAGPYLTLGTELAAAVLLMFGIGWWLDRRLGTSPWMMIAGMIFGIGAGLFLFIRSVNEIIRDEDAKKKREKL